MKANELRIGNWVMIDPSNIAQQVCDVMCDSVNTKNVQGAHYGLVDAIPLTEEWLLKFGFEHWDIKAWAIKGKISIYKQDGVFWYITHSGNEVCLEYVHQLQNLYFALTGEELTHGGDK